MSAFILKWIDDIDASRDDIDVVYETHYIDDVRHMLDILIGICKEEHKDTAALESSIPQMLECMQDMIEHIKDDAYMDKHIAMRQCVDAIFGEIDEMMKPYCEIEIHADCPICLEHIDGTGANTKCNHQFHIECIDEWTSEHYTCPMCRGEL
jgi:hypothetical protein